MSDLFDHVTFALLQERLRLHAPDLSRRGGPAHTDHVAALRAVLDGDHAS